MNVFINYGYVGAMDGTCVECVVLSDLQASFRNQKGFTSQNMLAIVDFDLKFSYLVAGWEDPFTMLEF